MIRCLLEPLGYPGLIGSISILIKCIVAYKYYYGSISNYTVLDSFFPFYTTISLYENVSERIDLLYLLV